MEVKKAIKTKMGTVVFEGELTNEEHDYVLTVGLNTMLEAGALPFKHFEDEEDLINVSIPKDADFKQ